MAPISQSEIEDLEIPIPSTFQGFNPREAITIYRRNLPHWRQDGASYFVTFRLNDSIPEPVSQQWKETLNSTITAEEQRRIQIQLEKTLDDCHGSCILREQLVQKITADSLMHFDGIRYRLNAAVIMPNHVHVIVTPLVAYSLEELLHSWKSYTSHEIGRVRNMEGTIWQADSFDRIIRDEEHYRRNSSLHIEEPNESRTQIRRLLVYSIRGRSPCKPVERASRPSQAYIPYLAAVERVSRPLQGTPSLTSSRRTGVSPVATYPQ